MDCPLFQSLGQSANAVPFLANSLKVNVLNLMRKKEHIENLISSFLTEILERSMTLDKRDQIAIYQEFKEWIHGDTKEEDIWVIDRPIK